MYTTIIDTIRQTKRMFLGTSAYRLDSEQKGMIIKMSDSLTLPLMVNNPTNFLNAYGVWQKSERWELFDSFCSELYESLNITTYDDLCVLVDLNT